MTNYPISDSTFEILSKSSFPGLTKGCSQSFVTDVLRETFGIDLGYFRTEADGYIVYAFRKKFYEDHSSMVYLELSNNEGDSEDPFDFVKGKTLQEAVEKIIKYIKYEY